MHGQDGLDFTINPKKDLSLLLLFIGNILLPHRYENIYLKIFKRGKISKFCIERGLSEV